jgi:branched-chain amino acid aminotransferase
MMEGLSWIWVSGADHPVPPQDASVSALDRGFVQGEAIYETMRTYHARPFASQQHLGRLLRGAEAWGFPPFDTGDLEEALEDLAARRAPLESALRITLSRGAPHPWAPEEDLCDPTWTLFAGPLPAHVSAYYERGVRCIVASRVRWNPGGFIPAVKFTGNPEILLAKREARAAGAFEAILLNSSGLVAEGASSNIFLVKNRRLVTPSLQTGILDGVTRAVVLELAQKRGLPVEERDVAAWELLQAEEVFLTSTLKEVIPVVEIGGAPVGRGEPGLITDHLLGAYQERCLESCATGEELEEAGA